MRRLLFELDCPIEDFRIVHVAGTNGKGSVAASIASMLGASGKRVGLFTSPHLVRVEERFVVNGQSLSREELDECLEALKSVGERVGHPRFFEAMLVLALLAFRRNDLPWVVLEVGLGGRFDPTNIFPRPEAGAIVSVSPDHQEVLGDSLVQIAREKAGIVKRGIPLVVGALDDNVREVVEVRASRLNSPLWILGRDFRVRTRTEASSDQCSEITQDHYEPLSLPVSLRSATQRQNAAVAVALGRVVGLSDEACRTGLESVRWPARFESVIWQGSEVLIDCAHNLAGFKAVGEYVETLGWKRFRLAVGFSRGKPWKEMLALLEDRVHKYCILEPLDAPCIPSEEVSGYLESRGYSVIDFGKSYRDFIKVIPGDTPLVMLGSCYLIGYIREIMLGSQFTVWSSGG